MSGLTKNTQIGGSLGDAANSTRRYGVGLNDRTTHYLGNPSDFYTAATTGKDPRRLRREARYAAEQRALTTSLQARQRAIGGGLGGGGIQVGSEVGGYNNVMTQHAQQQQQIQQAQQQAQQQQLGQLLMLLAFL